MATGAASRPLLRRMVSRDPHQHPRGATPLELLYDLCFVVAIAIMRVGLVGQWLRAARTDASARRTALRYAGGIAALQVGWLALLAAPGRLWLAGWALLVPLELLVPWWAEKAGNTRWHPHHIAERFGLLTIIVIGESVLAATVAIQSAIDLEAVPGRLVAVIVAAPVILFAMWWIYFLRPGHARLTSTPAAFVWGYGHYVIFASAAGVGAGLAVSVDSAVGKAHVSTFWAGQALAVPVSLFVLSVWFLHVRRGRPGRLEVAAYLSTAALVLAAPFTGLAASTVAVLMVALTAVSVALSCRDEA